VTAREVSEDQGLGLGLLLVSLVVLAYEVTQLRALAFFALPGSSGASSQSAA